MAQYAKVLLRGLTVAERVWDEGDLVPFGDLPKAVQKLVKDGKHPYLELVSGSEVEAEAGSDDAGIGD